MLETHRQTNLLMMTKRKIQIDRDSDRETEIQKDTRQTLTGTCIKAEDRQGQTYIFRGVCF